MEAQSLTILTTVILVLMLGTLIFSFVQYWLHRIRERQARKDEEALRQIEPPKPYVLTEAASTAISRPTVPPPVPATPKAEVKPLHQALASQNEIPTAEMQIPKKEKSPFTVTMLEPPTGERNVAKQTLPKTEIETAKEPVLPVSSEIKEEVVAVSEQVVAKIAPPEASTPKVALGEPTIEPEIKILPQNMLPDMPTAERSIDEVFTPPRLTVNADTTSGDGAYAGGDSAGGLHTLEDLIGPEPLVLESIGSLDVKAASPMKPSSSQLFMVPVEFETLRPRMTIERSVPKKSVPSAPKSVASPAPTPMAPQVPPPATPSKPAPPRRDETPEWN